MRMGARVRVGGAPSTNCCVPHREFGVEVPASTTAREGLPNATSSMMLRSASAERMNGSFVPRSHGIFRLFSASDEKKLAYAKPDALVMHRGPDEPRRRDRFRSRRRCHSRLYLGSE